MLCRFCNKECKNSNSLRNHERLCKSNPNYQVTYLEKNRSFIPQRNGANTAKDEGREFIVYPETRSKLAKANLSRTDEWNKENGKKIAKTVNEKVANGEWHTSLAKHMHIDYKGNDLHGSWELKYAMFLDENKIAWVRNKDSFSYYFNGKERKYTPDFYLPGSDEYIEIKGYKTEKDEAKWTQFPTHRTLIVLMEKELREMKIL